MDHKCLHKQPWLFNLSSHCFALSTLACICLLERTNVLKSITWVRYALKCTGKEIFWIHMRVPSTTPSPNTIFNCSHGQPLIFSASISIQGSTSDKPVLSSHSPLSQNLVPPNTSKRESNAWATWLQSFAEVCCLSRSKFESPNPNTANCTLSFNNDSGCVLVNTRN